MEKDPSLSVLERSFTAKCHQRSIGGNTCYALIPNETSTHLSPSQDTIRSLPLTYIRVSHRSECQLVHKSLKFVTAFPNLPISACLTRWISRSPTPHKALIIQTLSPARDNLRVCFDESSLRIRIGFTKLNINSGQYT